MFIQMKSLKPAKSIKLLGGLAAGAALIVACGTDPAPLTAGGDAGSTAAQSGVASEAAINPIAASPVDATVGASALGDILVGPNGMSLYGFTNDAQAASTCYGTCADAWPPVLADRDFTLAPGLDEGLFATTTREDGTFQLVAGKWPLYYFAGDAVPGDVKGQGSGDVWFVVTADGVLITDTAAASDAAASDPESSDTATAEATPAPAAPSDSDGQPVPVGVSATEAGEILVDAGGLSLYGFTNDSDGQSNCDGACADAWPPLLVDGVELPRGLDPQVFSIVTRSDGSFQLKAGKWPLYRFAGDGGPGEINGQGSGGVWFLAGPDGSLLKGESAAASMAGSDTDSSAEQGSDSDTDDAEDDRGY